MFTFDTTAVTIDSADAFVAELTRLIRHDLGIDTTVHVMSAGPIIIDGHTHYRVQFSIKSPGVDERAMTIAWVPMYGTLADMQARPTRASV